jgi:hypothetical protein
MSQFIETTPGQFELAPFDPIASADEHRVTARLASEAFQRDYAAAREALAAGDIVRAQYLTDRCGSHLSNVEHYGNRARSDIEKAIALL